MIDRYGVHMEDIQREFTVEEALEWKQKFYEEMIAGADMGNLLFLVRTHQKYMDPNYHDSYRQIETSIATLTLCKWEIERRESGEIPCCEVCRKQGDFKQRGREFPGCVPCKQWRINLANKVYGRGFSPMPPLTGDNANPQTMMERARRGIEEAERMLGPDAGPKKIKARTEWNDSFGKMLEGVDLDIRRTT